MGNSPADCSLGGPATARGVPALPARRHWAMLLTPTPEPGRPAVPDDALQVFARIGWSVPVDRVRGRTLSVVTESSLDVDRGVRHRDRRRGHRPSRRHAGGLGAARLPLAPGVGGTGFGTRQLPAAPVPTGERAYGDVVVTRDRVATFVAATGIDHPLHADLAHCRGMGFDDVVVQGLELVDDVVRSSGASIGTVEAWFRKPVVAGETVALGSADDGVWTMRAAGGELALIARVESCGLGTIRRGAAAVTADTAPVAEPLLVIRDFRTRFLSRSGPLTAVEGVTFALHRGKTLGIVGESGSGKTVLSRSIMGLVPSRRPPQGSVRYDGRDCSPPPPRRCGLWGRRSRWSSRTR